MSHLDIFERRTYANNWRCKKKGVIGQITKEELKNLVENTSICSHCNKNIEKWSIDHKIPLRKGGFNIILNIQIICHNCNRDKERKDE